MTKKNIWWAAILFGSIVVVVSLRVFVSPVGHLSYVMLTWRSEDTSTTTTVLYQTRDNPTVSKVYFDTERRGGLLSKYRFYEIGRADHFTETQRTIHTVELTGLKPKTDYYFTIADENGPRGGEFAFRTLPADNSPIRIVVGGDMDITAMARKVSAVAAGLNPDLAIIGGDLAYAHGKISKASDWDEWLDNWSELMVTTDGRLIPIIAAIGNHEINSLETQSAYDKAPFFTRYLNQDDVNFSYFTRKLGANLSLLVLDSNHLHAAGAAQRTWIEQQLKKYRNLAYRIAVYHRPLYPGGLYPGVEPGPALDLTEQWLDLFDRYRLTIGLENHFHVYKRSKSLFQRAVSENDQGTVYLGDGAWGTDPREVVNDLWYLVRADSKNHFWVLDVDHSAIEFRAVDSNGDVFDRGRIEMTQKSGAIVQPASVN